MRCFILAALMLATAGASAQTDTTRVSTLTAVVSAGPVFFLPELEIDRDQLRSDDNGWGGLARLMWQPGNLLSGGLEFGYHGMYSVENKSTGGTASRSAIPLFLIFSMSPFEGFDVSIGYGVAFLRSVATGANETVSNSSVSTALLGSLAYRYPVSERWGVGAEVRYNNYDLLDDHLLSVYASASYRLHTY